MHDRLDPVTTDADRAALDALWGASQAADDRSFRPQGGWWSLARWAATSVLLAAGSTLLHAHGASSVMLGVDAGAPAPLALYRSAGFGDVDRLELWERPLSVSVRAVSMPTSLQSL